MTEKPRWFPSFTYNLQTQRPEIQPMRFYEVYPPLAVEEVDYTPLQHAFSGLICSLEVWRESADAQLRIVVGVPSESVLNAFRRAYPGVRFEEAYVQGGVRGGSYEPAFVRLLEEEPLFFSAELSHALPFAWVEHNKADYGSFINALCASLHGPCWIQLVWCMANWDWLAEEAAMRLQSWILQVMEGEKSYDYDSATARQFIYAVFGKNTVVLPEKNHKRSPLEPSTLYQVGRSLAEEYFQKAHSTPLLLHIRGLLGVGDFSGLDAALGSVRVHWDTIIPFPFKDPRALRWMRARAIPDPTDQLRWHAEGGFLHEWGQGRELIPTLCITPEELPVFVHLPTDPSLPLKWSRQPSIAATQPQVEEGLSLWQ